MKKRFFYYSLSFLSITILCLSTTACSKQKNNHSTKEAPFTEKKEKTKTMVDMTGKTIVLPKQTKKVINLWPANNQVQMLLSGTSQLSGTTKINKTLPWATLVFPDLKHIPAYTLKTGGAINTEEMTAQQPDIVITADTTQIDQLKTAKLNEAYLTFRDFDGLKETVTKTAAILGNDAPKKAKAFNRYFDQTIRKVQEALKDTTHRPKVYEIQGDNPLKTDGKNSIATQWIEASGGQNVMSAITDENMTQVTMEEVIKAKPDVIILGTQEAKKIKEDIQNDARWQMIPAVKKKQIFVNPIGTFLWSRYSCEEALQVLWAAKILHPKELKEIDLVKEVQYFYHTFYNFSLDTQQATRILNGENPL